MFILIDKPKGITSHDVIDEVRKITNERKVGHAGTLDPNATGLLLVAIGRDFTKRLSEFVGLKKTYIAEIYLGATSTTDDSEGVITKKSFKNKPAQKHLNDVLESFLGVGHQTPPIYSAIKVRGKPAHRRVRKGEKIDLEPRKITVYSIKLIKYKYPLLNIETKVSSGTYIRALARDIGKQLGCGAYLSELRRTSIGKHKITASVKLGKLNQDNWKKFTFK